MAHCDSDSDLETITGSSEWFEATSSRDRTRRQNVAIAAMAAGRQEDLHEMCGICVYGGMDETGDYRKSAAGKADEVGSLTRVDEFRFHWACVNGNLPVAKAIHARIGDQSAKDDAHRSICGALERGYVEVAEWLVTALDLPRARLAGYVKGSWDVSALPAESRVWIERSTSRKT